jgi:hypothetical protein
MFTGIKRNTTNILRKGQEAKQVRTSQLNLNLNVLIRQKKDIEREIFAPQWQELQAKFRKDTEEKKTTKDGLAEQVETSDDGGGGGTVARIEREGQSLEFNTLLQRKYDLLCASIMQKQHEIFEANLMLEHLKQKICAISETNISRLLLELETGGNIRLEDGKPSDVWYTSCVDLVQSRIYGDDFQSFGIKGISI